MINNIIKRLLFDNELIIDNKITEFKPGSLLTEVADPIENSVIKKIEFRIKSID